LPTITGKLSVRDVPMLLEALACGDATVQQQTLGVLCPCRNRVYEIEVWREIFRVYSEADMAIEVRGDKTMREVRNRAAHAIQTLNEFARTQEMARELIKSLETYGITTRLDTVRKTKRVEMNKLASQRLEVIEETLACGTHEDQKELLTALCPCRNRRYDQNVWLAIFRAAEEGETGAIRDQAGHAIGTLMERVKTDPRSQKLVRTLMEEGLIARLTDDAIPTWIPNLRSNGLYIPRFERSPRSKANRRK